MIEKILIISFIVMAIWASMLEGEIFGKIRKLGNKDNPKFFEKPLYDCPVCMTPYYGSIAYWLIYGLWLHAASWQEWIVVVLAAMGLNAILVNLFRE